jgi:toxin ParE1/3/4
VKVVWTDTALDHLEAIHAYIAKTSSDYALRVVDRLTRRSQQIAEFPQSGRELPEYELAQVREVIEGAYRLIYHIKADQIEVLAVIHAFCKLRSPGRD